MEVEGHQDPLDRVSGQECRICLKKPLQTRQLFHNDHGIPEKLMAVASVQVEEGDGLPPVICLPCNRLLDASYDFKRQIQSSDRKLRRILELNAAEGGRLTSASIVKAIIADVISNAISCSKSEVQEVDVFSADDQTSSYLSAEAQKGPLAPKEEEEDDLSDRSKRRRVDDSLSEGRESSKSRKVSQDLLEVRTFKTEEEEDPEQLPEDNGGESRVEGVFEEPRAVDEEEEKPLIWRTARLRCGQCIKSFRSKLALQRHSIVHKRKTKLRYVCYVCDKQFSSIAKLKSHVAASHEADGRSKEALQDKRVARASQKPFEAKEEKRSFKFACKVCAKQFTYQKSFVTHAKSHPEYQTESEGYVCEKEAQADCAEEEDAEEEEFEEEEEDEDDGDLPAESLQCTQCGKLFATKRNLKRHVSTHSGLKYNCSTCGKGFSRADKLKDHEQSKHKSEMFESSEEDKEEDGAKTSDSDRKKDRHNRPHKCAVCPKSFAQAQSLANHMERHKRVKETQKRFLCEVCSKCFAQSGSLVAHMRTHTGVKPYVCNVCSRAFTKSTYLQLHLRTHSGEKPYICQYCSRAFARANTLARHITMHTGEAKYHCQICTKSFRRLTSLNEHTYTHTGQRPYACKICTKRYNNAGSLYAHRKKCKAQQLSSGGFTVSVEGGGEQQDGSVPQVLIYSQRKLVEDATVGQVTPTPQYMIANVHNQKGLASNIIQPFAVDDPNVYAINSKQFKNPYYTIYPNM